MLKKFVNFIKYNNAVVFIILAVFILGSGVFAQTEAGQEFIGQKQTVIEGVDNTLLLEADLEAFDMDFKIEKIESDDKYYYVTYTYLDLRKVANVWQYEMQEKLRKVSLNIDSDLGPYLAEELSEQYEARIIDLQKQKAKQSSEKQVRVESTEYDGLIGQTLVLASKVFPDYELVKKKELPSPSVPALLSLPSVDRAEGEAIAVVDDFADIYNDYIEEMDPDQDDVFGVLDNCPNDFNPLQDDEDFDGVGDVCDIINNEEVSDEVVATDIATPTEEIILEEVEETPVEELVDSSVDEVSEEPVIIEEEIITEETPVEEETAPEEAPVEEETVEIIELN